MTTTGGAIIAAVSGTDYATPSQITSSYPFTTTTHFGTTTSATSTPLFLRGSTFSLFASSTSVFTNASTTQLTIGADFISDFSSGLAISAAGVVTVDDVTAVMLVSGDFGDLSCNGTTCSFDADTVSDSEIDYPPVTLADFTNDADYVKWANATSSLWQSTGLLSTASSTIGSGAQAGGLTISGGATTTGFLAVTGTTGTTSIASGQGFTIGSTQFVVQQTSGRIGIGTAAPTVGFDVGVATKISGDLTISGGSALTISATGPVNQTGTGQVTFAGNVDATNGLDVTNANFTVGGSNFTVAQSTGNTIIAGTLGLTGAFNASSTLQATGAARLYSTFQADGAITAAGAGTGLSVTNNASVGGTFSLTGAGTFGSTLAVAGLLTAATTTFTGDVALSGKKITGVGSPSA